MANKTRSTDFRASRRDLLKALGAGAAAAALPQFMIVGDAGAQSQTLYVNTWGSAWTEAEKEAFFDPFTAETGVAVRPVSPVSYAKLRAQVQSRSYEYDVTELSQPEWLLAEKEGYAEPIDWNIIDKAKIPESAILGPSIGYCTLASILTYRTDRFPNGGPKSWADFWDVEKFPGTRSLFDNNPARILTIALLADGVAPADLYPIDVDRAFRKLDEIKPHIKVWWKESAQSQQLLRDGEVDMIALWSARAFSLINEGVPADVVWDQALIHTTSWGVVKGAPNKDIAWKFIEFATQPEQQAVFCSKLFYGPTNPATFELMPEQIAKQMPTYPANLERGVAVDPQWEADNYNSLRERFTQWLAS
jgi:putative spermidine/putrescine transport system substrate-binding protein